MAHRDLNPVWIWPRFSVYTLRYVLTRPTTMGMEGFWFFYLVILSPLMGCPVQPRYNALSFFPQYFCILLGHVQWISLGDLLFFEEKWRRSRSWGQGKLGRGTWKSEGSWNGYQGIIYEKRINALKMIEFQTRKIFLGCIKIVCFPSTVISTFLCVC